jgi:ABC-type polysaccharide/polyol phosphate export permease
MHFGVFIDDLGYAIAILLNMMFYLSGIFYDIETTMAAPLGSIIARANPMAFLINSMRNALLYETAPDLTLMGIWFLVSVILCAIGVRIIYKYENSYVKVV